MSARATHRPRPLRSRGWTPPGYGDLFRRKSDDTVWSVKGVYRVDRQVRLERAGDKCFPFAEQLTRDYERLSL